MHPILLKISSFELPSYGVSISIGIVLSFVVLIKFVRPKSLHGDTPRDDASDKESDINSDKSHNASTDISSNTSTKTLSSIAEDIVKDKESDISSDKKNDTLCETHGNTLNDISREEIINCSLLAIIFGFIGAKVLYVVTIFGDIVGRFKEGDFTFSYLIGIFRGGYVFYGGLIFGILGIIIYTRIKKINTFKVLDCYAIVLPLAQGFGRIGCFLAGCCYGKESEHFGIHFNESLIAPHNVKLIPTQIIESGFCFILFAVLILISKEKIFKKINVQKNPFLLSMIYLYAYTIFRFIIEFFRGDEYRGFILNISTSQIISLVVIIILTCVVAVRKSKTEV